MIAMDDGHWEDILGIRWTANKRESTTYPNGKPDLVVLESSWGTRTWIRYNEIGDPIAGNMSLTYVRHKNKEPEWIKKVSIA